MCIKVLELELWANILIQKLGHVWLWSSVKTTFKQKSVSHGMIHEKRFGWKTAEFMKNE